MLTVSYIFSQIFAIINYATLIISYQIKDNKKILIYSTIWCSFSAVSFYLLKAYTGCTMASLAVLRNILFMLDNKYGRGKNIYTLLFIILSLIVRTIFTYDGLLSLLPVIATLLYTISVWVDDNDLKRFSDSDEKDLYSMLQLRKTGNADRKEDRPVTYISTMEVNSSLRKRGIFKKMCKMLINFVNPNQHIVTTKQTEMGLVCKTFNTLSNTLIYNGFENYIFEDNYGMIHSELHDIVCSKQKVLKK